MKQVYIALSLVIIYSIIMGVLNYRTHRELKRNIATIQESMATIQSRVANLEGFLVTVSKQPDGSNLYQVYVNQLKK